MLIGSTTYDDKSNPADIVVQQRAWLLMKVSNVCTLPLYMASVVAVTSNRICDEITAANNRI
jgi:hypothetical protein